MERRNFFKNMFAIGVVATIPRYDFNNPEIILPPEPTPEILEPDKVYNAVPIDSGVNVKLLDKNGKLLAYCGGFVKPKVERERIDITSRDDVMMGRPPKFTYGRATTHLELNPIIIVNHETVVMDLIVQEDMRLEIIREDGSKITCKNVLAEIISANVVTREVVSFSGTFRLNGAITFIEA